MERPPSPGQHLEQKEPQETPNFEGMDDRNSNSPLPMEDLSQILLHADSARAESTPLHKTQRGSAAGTQATEEKERTPVHSVTSTSTSPPSTNPFDATQGSALATAPATPAAFPFIDNPAMPGQPGSPDSQGQLTTPELRAPSDSQALIPLASEAGVMAASLLNVPTWFARRPDALRGGHVLRHLTESGGDVAPGQAASASDMLAAFKSATGVSDWGADASSNSAHSDFVDTLFLLFSEFDEESVDKAQVTLQSFAEDHLQRGFHGRIAR